MCACVHVVTVIKIKINMPYLIHMTTVCVPIVEQRLGGRASGSRIRESWFESCDAV